MFLGGRPALFYPTANHILLQPESRDEGITRALHSLSTPSSYIAELFLERGRIIDLYHLAVYSLNPIKTMGTAPRGSTIKTAGLPQCLVQTRSPVLFSDIHNLSCLQTSKQIPRRMLFNLAVVPLAILAASVAASPVPGGLAGGLRVCL